jgi:hypothetical protein
MELWTPSRLFVLHEEPSLRAVGLHPLLLLLLRDSPPPLRLLVVRAMEIYVRCAEQVALGAARRRSLFLASTATHTFQSACVLRVVVCCFTFSAAVGMSTLTGTLNRHTLSH